MAQAFYRKYRSKSLQEVVGQKHITDTLQRALKNGVTSHAYLFTGLKGTGKTSVARILAHNINELPYADESTHLDIIEIDAASNRRIDDIRDLREKVHIAPTSAKYKVYIIDEVHMLTGESFNALLKTLEEPPAHVVFILATTEVHKLPATIISRTQRFHFRAVAKDKVVGHLRYICKQEDITIDDESLALIAEYGEGSFRDSISLLDQLASMSGKKIDSVFVEQNLGLASSKTVETLVSLLRDGDRKKLHKQLQDLEDQGVSPTVLSKQIVRTLQPEAIKEPRFYALMESLIDLPKSPQPALKLLVTLLMFIPQEPAAHLQNPPTYNKTVAAHTSAQAVHTVKQSPAVLKKSIVKPLAQQAAQPTNVPDIQPAHAPKDDTPLTATQWPQVLAEIRQSNPPFFSMLKNADPRFNGNTLTLAFSFKLHATKLNDARYRTQLAECVAKLGYVCPALHAEHDPTAKAPVFAAVNESTPQENETAASVLAMMGGGDIVNA